MELAELLAQKAERIVALVKTKRVNPQKGNGFAQSQAGGKDVFVYISAMEKAGHARPRRKISKFSDDG
jgi:hypothetical protein